MKNNIFKLSILILYVITIEACGSLNNGLVEDNRIFRMNESRSDDSGCWMKCIMTDQYAVNYKEVFKYSGSDFRNELVELEQIETSPASTLWEKKANPNCTSSRPEECEVWCLVEIEPTYEEYYVVTDTNALKEFETVKVEIKTLVKSGGYTEWKQVLCDNEITAFTIEQIQSFLIEEKYLTILIELGELSKEDNKALVLYQKENKLPIGGFNFETLEHMGVSMF